MVIWICGLSGSGKTALCNELWRLLKKQTPNLVLLDGDMLRAAFGHDLGYSEQDRVVQIKRLQNIAKLLSDQDLVVIVGALYSHPELFRWNQRNIRNYFEVYLCASMETVEERDDKNLYSKALSGEISEVVGVDIPWNVPESPNLILDIDHGDPVDILAAKVLGSIPALAKILETR